MAFCFPIGAGLKYNISEKMNISFEIAQRFTTTDYLDDVGTLILAQAVSAYWPMVIPPLPAYYRTVPMNWTLIT